MGSARRLLPAAILALSSGVIGFSALADETSTGDKLRILYSNRFTFTDDGIPLVTVELMSGQSEVRLEAAGGILVKPDGDGAAVIEGGQRWTIRVEGARPATIREWTVVERFDPEDESGVRAALARWTERGYEPQRFEVGSLFGVEGEVIDGREVLVAIAPVAAPGGGRKAAAIGSEHGIETSVHAELMRRPQGTIVADNGEVTVRNRSVIWFAPRAAGATLEVKDVVTGAGGSQLETGREDRHYFGMVYVTLDRDGALTAVNAVPADRLLAGLVPSEIYPSAPESALEAQAIAARTELLQKLGTRHLTDPYLLCSSQHCQVYSGAGKEHERTTAAVTRTRGQILLRGGGGIADTRYSAACGGHTEHNENIWGGAADPALRGRFDGARAGTGFADGVSDGEVSEFLALPDDAAWCGRTRFSKGRYRWSTRLEVAELSERVAEQYPNVGSVRALEPLERGHSGRIKRLRIRGSRGEAIASGDLHIRRLLGGLRSTLFRVSTVGSKTNPSAFEVEGAGFGHGVGMCQLGAIGMADAGKSAGQILQHYYAGTRIRRLY